MGGARVSQLLPARTCSTCANWYAYAAGFNEEKGVLVAPCGAHGKSTAGGDKCSKWTRGRREPLGIFSAVVAAISMSAAKP
jgi:hypothetical protein